MPPPEPPLPGNAGPGLAPDAAPETVMPDPPLLELRRLDKRFTGTHALKGIDLAFRRGEIHAIVGENGAGKSTLIKLLTGVHRRSSGTILWEGREAALDTPQDAIALGINAVHQEVVLCPHLSVAANMFLGEEQVRFGLLRRRSTEKEAQRVLAGLGFEIPAGALLGSLTIGQQQLVATARAAIRGTRFLIFDEPTAYLTRREAGQLFRLIRDLHAAGVTIVYISHRLEEIFELADRVTVLRDGQLVSTRKVSETDERTLIRDMVARSIEQVHYKERIEPGRELLRVRDFSGPGFRNIGLDVREGEIVGLYGLVGAGRSEFVQCLFGRHAPIGGVVHWRGRPVRIRDERRAIALGMALVPESRRDQGLCLDLGVGFNLSLPVFGRISQLGLVDPWQERKGARNLIRDMRILAASTRERADTLSGGNQQKVVVGKWIGHGADLFIFDEPTVGVDVGTKAEIYRIFASLLRRGAGIILISSYLPEVYDLADRLHVFRGGRIVASHAHKEADMETILTEAIGA